MLEANPDYAYIKYADGRDSTVSLRRLAPLGSNDVPLSINETDVPRTFDVQNCDINEGNRSVPMNDSEETGQSGHAVESSRVDVETKLIEPVVPLRRSTREKRPPNFFHNEFN